MLRLLPMSDRDKDTEILASRHQIRVLQRQLGEEKARFTPIDRAFLATWPHRLVTLYVPGITSVLVTSLMWGQQIGIPMGTPS